MILHVYFNAIFIGYHIYEYSNILIVIVMRKRLFWLVEKLLIHMLLINDSQMAIVKILY